jgi:hypothetical protein
MRTFFPDFEGWKLFIETLDEFAFGRRNRNKIGAMQQYMQQTKEANPQVPLHRDR